LVPSADSHERLRGQMGWEEEEGVDPLGLAVSHE
jgi:hypothetical protein